MSKLNPAGKNVTNNVRAVAAKRGQKTAVSANGNLQFKKEPLQMLYELAVSTMFGKGTFYKTGDKLVAELRKHTNTAVEMGALDFVANLAIHARGEMNIRTIPIVLVVEFAKALRDQSKQYENMRRLVCDVIQRADQINDLYAYALDVFGGKNKVPMAIKRGVADAFNKFGEYNFAKYNRDGAVKFRDVLRIVHPDAKDDRQGAIFEKIMKDTLTTPYTWETELSANGQLPVAERKSKKDLWTELVKSGKMGYMALLRNLRNIHEAEVDAAVVRQYVCDVISDPEAVAKSKQLPFDFVEAYNVVKPLNSMMATAVSKALDHSVSNIPELGKRVWIVVDYSGSMGRDPDAPNDGGWCTGAGSMSAITTAALLTAAMLKATGDKSDQLAVTLFGSSAKTLHGVDTNNSVLAIKKELLSHRTGTIAGSTNFGAALAKYPTLGFVPDTIIVCTDGEVNAFPYSTLKAAKADMKIAINMAASSSSPMSRPDGWFEVAGWSSAMFKFIPAIRDGASVVDQLCGPYRGPAGRAQL